MMMPLLLPGKGHKLLVFIQRNRVIFAENNSRALSTRGAGELNTGGSVSLSTTLSRKVQ